MVERFSPEPPAPSASTGDCAVVAPTWRRRLAAVLVALSAVSVVLATVAVWAHRTVFDTESFMATVGPAIEDPAFYAAVSESISTELLAVLDIEGRVAAGLTRLDEVISEALAGLIQIPGRDRDSPASDRLSLAALAPSISQGLEARVAEVTEDFVTSPAFTSRFPDLVGGVHTAAVALVRGDTAALPDVYAEGGEVRLDLIPAIGDVLRRLVGQLQGFSPDLTVPDVISDRVDEAREQLAGALQTRLPEDFGQVVVMSTASLAGMQASVSALDRLVWAIVILTVGLVTLALWMSPTRRRTTVQLGMGVVIGLAVVWAVVRSIPDMVVAQLANEDTARAVGTLIGRLLSSLGVTALMVGLLALVLAVAAHLAGRPSWLGRLSERADSGAISSGHREWVADHYDAVRIAVLVIAVSVLVMTGFEVVPVIVVVALATAAWWTLAMLRRGAVPGAPVMQEGMDPPGPT